VGEEANCLVGYLAAVSRKLPGPLAVIVQSTSAAGKSALMDAALGANWSLHDLRHTAAYRMARDPGVPLTDIQWVLGHAHLSTTERYLSPQLRDVIETMLAFYAKGPERPAGPAAGYRAESLEALFGKAPK
jgi:integrase